MLMVLLLLSPHLPPPTPMSLFSFGGFRRVHHPINASIKIFSPEKASDLCLLADAGGYIILRSSSILVHRRRNSAPPFPFVYQSRWFVSSTSITGVISTVLSLSPDPIGLSQLLNLMGTHRRDQGCRSISDRASILHLWSLKTLTSHEDISVSVCPSSLYQIGDLFAIAEIPLLDSMLMMPPLLSRPSVTVSAPDESTSCSDDFPEAIFCRLLFSWLDATDTSQFTAVKKFVFDDDKPHVEMIHSGGYDPLTKLGHPYFWYYLGFMGFYSFCGFYLKLRSFKVLFANSNPLDLDRSSFFGLIGIGFYWIFLLVILVWLISEYFAERANKTSPAELHDNPLIVADASSLCRLWSAFLFPLLPGQIISVQRLLSHSEKFKTALKRTFNGILKAATPLSIFGTCLVIRIKQLDLIEGLNILDGFHRLSMIIEDLSLYFSFTFVVGLFVYSLILWFEDATKMIVGNV